jgi:hypothetical protein
MPATRQPLFLARTSYRKRRLRDGARVLPIFGLLLLLLPLLWPQTARAIVAHWALVFAVWAGLIALSAAISRGLVDADSHPHSDDELPEPGSYAAPAPGPALTTATATTERATGTPKGP